MTTCYNQYPGIQNGSFHWDSQCNWTSAGRGGLQQASLALFGPTCYAHHDLGHNQSGLSQFYQQMQMQSQQMQGGACQRPNYYPYHPQPQHWCPNTGFNTCFQDTLPPGYNCKPHQANRKCSQPAQAKALGDLASNFDKFDTNRDGVLDKNELLAAAARGGANSQTLKDIAANEHNLMFANIDSGNPAWHGLSRADLGVLQNRTKKGESLSDISDSLRSQYNKERGYPMEADAFKAHIEKIRGQVPGGDAPACSAPADNPVAAQGGALGDLLSNFDKFDTNRDGVLDKSELLAAAAKGGPHAQALKEIAANEHNLMFASIDSGNPAWHGISRADLAVLQNRTKKGESLSSISDSLRSKFSKERGYPEDAGAFKAHIEQIRSQMPGGACSAQGHERRLP